MMHVRVEPPLDRWPTTALPVATGHQAWLWHPGILAKFIAADAAARQSADPRALHVVVDHDVYNPLRLDVPVREGEALRVRNVQLATYHATLPAGSQPAADVADVLRTLEDLERRPGSTLMADLTRLKEAWHAIEHDDPPHLAAQLARVLDRLMQPLDLSLPTIMTSQLMRGDAGRDMLARMVSEAPRCVRRYNAAVARHPEAGVMPLLDTLDRVELPLWLIGWGQPRRRVYADLADAQPMLTLEDGSPIDPARQTLAPRAILLSALLRTQVAGVFIHGLGGEIYDRITDAWWQDWLGQTPGFAAMVTADLHLRFDVPSASPDQLQRALWFAHHLPHNVDRVMRLNDDSVHRKRDLLAHMDDDRDKPRRHAAFEELHAINAALADRHATALHDARRQVERARVGLANQAVLARRDWCFALYPDADLRAMADQIRYEPRGAGLQ